MSVLVLLKRCHFPVDFPPKSAERHPSKSSTFMYSADRFVPLRSLVSWGERHVDQCLWGV